MQYKYKNRQLIDKKQQILLIAAVLKVKKYFYSYQANIMQQQANVNK